MQCLRKFPSLIKPVNCDSSDSPRVKHFLETTGPPVVLRSRRLDPVKLRVAKAEFEHIQRSSINRSSNSPWAIPMHMVSKKMPGELYSCGDYHTFISAMKPYRDPIPFMQDFSVSLSEIGLLETGSSKSLLPNSSTFGG